MLCALCIKFMEICVCGIHWDSCYIVAKKRLYKRAMAHPFQKSKQFLGFWESVRRRIDDHWPKWVYSQIIQLLIIVGSSHHISHERGQSFFLVKIVKQNICNLGSWCLFWSSIATKTYWLVSFYMCLSILSLLGKLFFYATKNRNDWAGKAMNKNATFKEHWNLKLQNS